MLTLNCFYDIITANGEMQVNIVIIGQGKVGSTLTEDLIKESHDITVIDINAKTIENGGTYAP